MYFVRDPPKLKKLREDFQLIHRNMQIKVDEHTDGKTWHLSPKCLHRLNRFLWNVMDNGDKEESDRRTVDWA